MKNDRIEMSDNTSISMPVRNMLAIIAAVAVGAWALDPERMGRSDQQHPQRPRPAYGPVGVEASVCVGPAAFAVSGTGDALSLRPVGVLCCESCCSL